MEEKRDILEPSDPKRQRELNGAIEKHSRELKRLLDEQRADLEALHGLRIAGGSTEPPADPDLAYLIRHWQALPKSVHKRIMDVAKASGFGEAGNINTTQEEPK